ncbi:MAG: carbohydrate ABC transporter permease [Planctomycetota bacterium]
MRRGCAAALKWALLGACLAAALYPLFWMLSTGLKPPNQAADWWGMPRALHFGNFLKVWAELEFPTWFANSALITAGAVACTLILGAPAGYALASMGFRGRGTVFALFAAGLMIPVHVTLVPLLKLFQVVGLYDTRVGLIAVYTAFSLPLAVVLFAGFFREIPREVLEAAALDGCGAWATFLRVTLPLARPALVGVTMITLVNVWNEFVFGLVLLQSPDNYTIPLGINSLRGEYGYGKDVPLMAAALAIAVLPPLLVYAVAQRQLIRGLTAGAVKG